MDTVEKILNVVVGLTLLGMLACLLAIFVPKFNRGLSVKALSWSLVIISLLNNAAWWMKIATRKTTSPYNLPPQQFVPLSEI